MFGLKIMTKKAYKAAIKKIQDEYNETIVAQEEENAALERENVLVSNVITFLANDAGLKSICGHSIKSQARKNRITSKDAAEFQAQEMAKNSKEAGIPAAPPAKNVEEKTPPLSRAEMAQALYDVCLRSMEEQIES